MRRQFRQFFAVAGLTALEAARQPVFLLAGTFCLAMIALLPIFITHTLGEGAKIVRDSGLALQFVFGLLLGGYGACSSLTREIRRGTAAAVLAKPVSHGVFFLAKFAGVALVTAAFSAAAIMAILMSVRTASPMFGFDWWGVGPLAAAIAIAYLIAGIRNYITRGPFVSGAATLLVFSIAVAFAVSGFLDAEGRPAGFGALFAWKILPAGVLIAAAVTVLTGIALSLAIRLDVVPTLSLCTVIFLVGLVSDYFFGRHAAEHVSAAVLYRLIPNWQHFWVADALSGPGTIPWSYVGWASLYAGLYLAAVLSLGMLAFRQTEVRA